MPVSRQVCIVASAGVIARFAHGNHAGTGSPNPPSRGGGVDAYFCVEPAASRSGEHDRREGCSHDHSFQHRHGSGTDELGHESTRAIGHPLGIPAAEQRAEKGPSGLHETTKTPVFVMPQQRAWIRGAPRISAATSAYGRTGSDPSPSRGGQPLSRRSEMVVNEQIEPL